MPLTHLLCCPSRHLRLSVILESSPGKSPPAQLARPPPVGYIRGVAFQKVTIRRLDGAQAPEAPRLLHRRGSRRPGRRRPLLPDPHGIPDHAEDRLEGLRGPGSAARGPCAWTRTRRSSWCGPTPRATRPARAGKSLCRPTCWRVCATWRRSTARTITGR